MAYTIKIEPKALADIQEITNWYNQRQAGLGKRFQEMTIEQIDHLRANPYCCAVRYNEIRCLVVKGFPYMVHFYINGKSKTVEILAVIGTCRNPDIWQKNEGIAP